MLSADLLASLAEVRFLRQECQKLIRESLSLVPRDQDGHYSDSFRVLVTPFLYSVWERCFTTCFGIMARIQRASTEKAGHLPSSQMALWLQAEPFFSSLVDKLKNIEDLGERRRIKGGLFYSLTKFLDQFHHWRETPLSSDRNVADLVMTFSKVNCEVVDVNAAAIGLDQIAEYKSFKRSIGRLEDLVGRRNDIGHGTMSLTPGNREFDELLTLTREKLINDFCEIVELWIIFKS